MGQNKFVWPKKTWPLPILMKLTQIDPLYRLTKSPKTFGPRKFFQWDRSVSIFLISQNMTPNVLLYHPKKSKYGKNVSIIIFYIDVACTTCGSSFLKNQKNCFFSILKFSNLIFGLMDFVILDKWEMKIKAIYSSVECRKRHGGGIFCLWAMPFSKCFRRGFCYKFTVVRCGK